VKHAQCNIVAHWLGKAIMALTGWRVEGEVPDAQKMVVIAAPHTSNWDFLYLLGAAYSLRLSIFWLGKNSLFMPVVGHVLRFLGGIAVDRSRHTNLVTQLVERFDESDKLAIVIPPSGTRSQTNYWHSGFYQIAKGANICMVCGFLDYPRKVAGLGLAFIPTGDIPADMNILREFYAPIQGRYPDKTSQVRLKDETS